MRKATLNHVGEDETGVAYILDYVGEKLLETLHDGPVVNLVAPRELNSNLIGRREDDAHVHGFSTLRVSDEAHKRIPAHRHTRIIYTLLESAGKYGDNMPRNPSARSSRILASSAGASGSTTHAPGSDEMIA